MNPQDIRIIREAIIVDIDGTIALRGDRSPYDLTRVNEDEPNIPILRLLYQAVKGSRPSLPISIPAMSIIFISGRQEKSRYATTEWLEHHWPAQYEALHMRPDNDGRFDADVKREIYETKIKPDFKVIWVFDDRNSVVKMWRELGLTCLQVADGDF